MRSPLKLAWLNAEWSRGGCEQPGGEAEQADTEPVRCGDGADQQGPAGVAELAAQLGGAHGLTQAAGRGGGRGCPDRNATRPAKAGCDSAAPLDTLVAVRTGTLVNSASR
jgi:hypothetical protein